MFTVVICKDTKEIAYTYDEYLQSSHWNDFRESYLKCYGSECQLCGNKGKNLHHISYSNLGNESFDDVIFLCEECHIKEHSIE
ncbi:hypothetical protein CBU02nite_26080 [Clostridium butyricum]|jgi:5-methylcytosine-specific restriction endonuclease McrA|uniref:HNH domain-containing protein n=1 Tax=Clostridium butyricum TaxID=1492 RepID=A0A512TPA8_CLOBU|nr:HNH endonuclease [Clostridium butyricum]NOW24887.1 5-methylcytosine-specific restriction endonuclease McrA [Clostridium butyricum]GEQ22102.1 hypothetical protein CBU02nite_26080 [Clostridium butyricum]